MGGVKKEKAALRRELLARRDALPGRAEKSRAIQSRVLALPEYRRARRVLLYLSKGSEVDTWPLLDRALAQGKEVYAPRCLEGPGEMAFYRVSSREDLQAGAFDLLEHSGAADALAALGICAWCRAWPLTGRATGWAMEKDITTASWRPSRYAPWACALRRWPLSGCPGTALTGRCAAW